MPFNCFSNQVSREWISAVARMDQQIVEKKWLREHEERIFRRDIELTLVELIDRVEELIANGGGIILLSL